MDPRLSESLANKGGLQNTANLQRLRNGGFLFVCFLLFVCFISSVQEILHQTKHEQKLKNREYRNTETTYEGIQSLKNSLETSLEK